MAFNPSLDIDRRFTDVMRAYLRTEPETDNFCSWWEMESEEVARDFARVLMGAVPELKWVTKDIAGDLFAFAAKDEEEWVVAIHTGSKCTKRILAYRVN